MSCLPASSYTAKSVDRLYPITVQIQNSYGGFSPVSALSDSGNESSIMKKEVADMLGLDLSQGESMNVGGINGGTRQFKKFRLLVRIGSLDAIPVTIGFATKSGDLVENLIGNSDIVKSGKFEVTYNKDTVTYRTKGMTGNKVAGCSSYADEQPTLNNLYEQLSTRRKRVVPAEQQASYYTTYW